MEATGATWEQLKEQAQEEILLDSLDMSLKNSEVKTSTASRTSIYKQAGWLTIGLLDIILIVDWYIFYGKGTIWFLYWITGLIK